MEEDKDKEIINETAPEGIEQPEMQPEGEIAEAEAGESVDEAPVENGRSRWANRLREYDPEGSYDDDEGFYAGLDRYAEERDKQLNDYRDFDERLHKSIEADPRTGQFICNVLDEVDFAENLLDVMGPELADIVNSPEAKEKIMKARKEAEEEAAKRAANEETTQQNYEAFAADKDPEKLEQFGDRIIEVFEQAKEGLLTPEFLDALWKGFNYDADIAQAEENARIQGRNERIVATMRPSDKGDGVPNLASASALPRQGQPASRNRKSIWDK